MIDRTQQCLPVAQAISVLLLAGWSSHIRAEDGVQFNRNIRQFFQQDGDTWQWIWRDWVARALNDHLPFDQFTIWQLAGDLLPNAPIDQQIASGFNRNHLLNGEGGTIPEEQRFVNLFDRIDTTATTWLGLTMACAQCHDHKCLVSCLATRRFGKLNESGIGRLACVSTDRE